MGKVLKAALGIAAVAFILAVPAGAQTTSTQTLVFEGSGDLFGPDVTEIFATVEYTDTPMVGPLPNTFGILSLTLDLPDPIMGTTAPTTVVPTPGSEFVGSLHFDLFDPDTFLGAALFVPGLPTGTGPVSLFSFPALDPQSSNEFTFAALPFGPEFGGTIHFGEPDPGPGAETTVPVPAPVWFLAVGGLLLGLFGRTGQRI